MPVLGRRMTMITTPEPDHLYPATSAAPVAANDDTAVLTLGTDTAAALGGSVVSRSGLATEGTPANELTTHRNVTEPGFQFLTDAQIENLPPPEWLIDNVIQARAIGLLVGEPAVGKTFLALDWACSIVEGVPWSGHESKRGCVVYVAAEGVEGMGTRLRAWKREHGVTSCSGLQTVPEALPLVYDRQLAPHIDRFIEQAARHRPVLVVLDTLARCMVGADEDSARDMGIAVAAADRIRDRLQCAVLILHHPTKRRSGKP